MRLEGKGFKAKGSLMKTFDAMNRRVANVIVLYNSKRPFPEWMLMKGINGFIQPHSYEAA